ncbi:MAG: Eco57I restriction-modification methylase domain-containing protein [Thermoguttaceae bacterium]|jgi:hypothetical protein
MKFDFIIGNPPYQEETQGTSDKPIYNLFMDESYKIGSNVILITPARFLFDAGKTPRAWNKKMLADPYLKILFYEQKSSRVFSNTDIKGGIAVSYRSEEADFGPIGTFSTISELNTILRKVISTGLTDTLDDIIFAQNKWNLESLYSDYPAIESKIGSNGREKRLTTPIFALTEVFHAKKTAEDIAIVGLINNKRHTMYVNKKYIDTEKTNLNYWKVILPKSNGSGAIGEVLSTPLVGEPLVGEPLVGYTQSFISFGSFNTEYEAQSLLKYIKTKFARCMLGILKVTQDNNKGTWRYVPLQDFTPASDIDWSKSISEIDRKLYKKYKLEKFEIDFIESRIKEMD